jgi:hypothetical protein
VSTLVDAVLERVTKRGIEVTVERVEQILADLEISTSATTGVPVRLRVARLHFSGTKKLRSRADVAEASGGQAGGGADGAEEAATDERFVFDWDIPGGVSGVGSGQNLRGKSSVLFVVGWALTGRCQLQDDVLSWMEHVEVEWRVDGARLEVNFDVVERVPRGAVVLIDDVEGKDRRTTLSRFDSGEEFESVRVWLPWSDAGERVLMRPVPRAGPMAWH